MESWIETVSEIETVGFFLLPSGNPYVKGVNSSIFPNDMRMALSRAYHKGELKLGVEVTGAVAATILDALYAKYNDTEHAKRRAVNEAKEKQQEREYRDSQMFGY